MKRLLLFGILFCINAAASAQHKYFIKFSDKNGSVYSINQPSAFLSQRAIARRLLYNIPVTDQDIPVNQNYVDSIIKIEKRRFKNGLDVVTLKENYSPKKIEEINSANNKLIKKKYIVFNTINARLNKIV